MVLSGEGTGDIMMIERLAGQVGCDWLPVAGGEEPCKWLSREKAGMCTSNSFRS